MNVPLSPPIHPGVPVMLHAGIARPPHAAGREALGSLYGLYAAIVDSENRRGPRCGEEEFRAVAAAVDRCLDELRRYRGVLDDGPELAATIERVESGKRLLERRWEGDR